MVENKKGRKYDRKKWGWKDESEIPENVKDYCHYSDLPSPSAYEDKHPYYDSDKKIRDDIFASKVVLGCVIGVIILTLVNLFMVMCRLNG
jgi:hypothetical protein